MRLILLANFLFCISACTSSPFQNTSSPSPEWRLEGRAMAAAADPRAVEAAIKILENGGHAVDAAIAAHSVLGLVEPQSSGLGGGAFMVVYDRKSSSISVFDGRETAPAAINERLFLNENEEPVSFIEAWQSGKSVGVPGAVAMYGAAHEAYGRHPWSELFVDAETLATEGFVVSPRLELLLSNTRLRQFMKLDDNPDTADYFYPNGEPLAAGDIRDNPEYAKTLKTIAEKGAAAFYEGGIAEAIVTAATAGDDGGKITLEDIASYKTVRRDAMCGPFLQFKVCSATAPSSGAVAQIMIAGLYERLTEQSEATGQEDSALKSFVLAQQLAYADRDHYVADPDFVDVPAELLVDSRYLSHRAQLPFEPGMTAKPGDPGEVVEGKPIIDMWGRDGTTGAAGTTHLSIVDGDGNVVSMTATVEAAFGSSRWAAGFLLNNELTDFSFRPEINGKPVANAVSPGKRPRSSMSPTIVFDENDDLFMVTGSPGGNSIIAYVAKTIVGVLAHGDSAQEAIDRPNIVARGRSVRVETDDPSNTGLETAQKLKAMGFEVRERQGETSGLHVIVARQNHFEGGADPRREGVATEVLLKN